MKLMPSLKDILRAGVNYAISINKYSWFRICKVNMQNIHLQWKTKYYNLLTLLN